MCYEVLPEGVGWMGEVKRSLCSFIFGDPAINRCRGPKYSKHLRSKLISEGAAFRVKQIELVSHTSTQFLSKTTRGSLTLCAVTEPRLSAGTCFAPMPDKAHS